MPYWLFLDRNLKNLWSYLESTPSNFSCCKVSCKNRNCLYFAQKCFIWVFEISIVKFVNCKVSLKKHNNSNNKNLVSLNLVTKSFSGYFRLKFKRTYRHISNQHPRICQNSILNQYNEFFFFLMSGSTL